MQEFHYLEKRILRTALAMAVRGKSYGADCSEESNKAWIREELRLIDAATEEWRRYNEAENEAPQHKAGA